MTLDGNATTQAEIDQARRIAQTSEGVRHVNVERLTMRGAKPRFGAEP